MFPQQNMKPAPRLAGVNNQNHFSGLFGLSNKTPFTGLPQKPNPLAGVKAPQQGLATANGVQQTMQKAANPAQNVWINFLKPSSVDLTELLEKIGATPLGAPAPTPGVTANMPQPPQPGMPQTSPGLGMPPPNGGAPISQGMGQPSLDPTTGQPIQQAQPQAPQQLQPGQPPQALNPQTGQPLTSPMQDAPPPALPMNPVMKPQRQPTQKDQYQQGVINDLGQDRVDADIPRNAQEAQDDMTAEAMAMGSKTAQAEPLTDPKGFHLRVAKELGEKAANSKTTFWKSATLTAPLPAQPSQMPASILARGVPKPKVPVLQPNAIKTANLTPFAKGFFEQCLQTGVDPQLAVEKVGKDYGDDAYRELHDGLEKLAGITDIAMKGLNFAKGVFGAGKRGTPFMGPPKPLSAPGGLPTKMMQGTGAVPIAAPAYTGTKAYQAGDFVNRNAGVVGQGLKQFGVGQTAMGAAGGALTGDDLGLGTYGGMAAGAAAMNPFLRRRMGNFTPASAPMAGMRTSMLGGMAGGGIDQTLGAMGINEQAELGADGKPIIGPDGKPVMRSGQTFGRLGAKGGFMLGMGQHAVRDFSVGTGAIPRLGLKGLPGGTYGKGLDRLNNPLTHATQFTKDVGMATLDPVVGLAKAMVRKPIQWASQGRYTGGKYFQPGREMLSGNKVRMTPGRIAGRLIGGTGMAATGIGTAGGYFTNKVKDTVKDSLGENMPEVFDAATEHADKYLASRLPLMGHLGDQYLDERGLLDQEGQFDPTHGMKQKFQSSADHLLYGMGLDPSRMSPLQKMMLLGGAGVGGAGLMTGNPLLAGAGGVAASASLLPYMLPGQSQQHFQGQPAPYQPGRPQQQQAYGPQYRNEFALQQQQQHG